MIPNPFLALRITIQLATPEVAIHCGDYLEFKATISNTDSDRIEFDEVTRLSYHWTIGDKTVVWDGVRTSLPRFIDGGDQTRIFVRLPAPPRHGTFSLKFGIVREGAGWFHEFTPDSVAQLNLIIDTAQTERSCHAELNTEAAKSLFINGNFRPLSLVCETINVCNQACAFCAYPHQTRTKGVMPLELFKTVLKQYEQIGGGPISLTTVGEILLDPLLRERLDAIETMSLVTGVSATTNATIAARLDESVLNDIFPRLSAIQISIYGLNEQENLEITKKNLFSEMVVGTQRILKRAKSNVTLAFRTAANRNDIDQWIQQHLDISECTSSIEIHGPLQDYGNFGIFNPGDGLFSGADWKLNNDHKTQCIFPAAAIKVFWDGNLSFCSCADHDNAEELDLGNVTATTLGDVIRSEKYAKLWNWSKHSVPDICRRCTHFLPLSDALSITDFFTDPQVTIGA